MTRIRVALGLGLILLMALLEIGREVPAADRRIRARLATGTETPITRAEARLRGALEALPPRGVCGYRASGRLAIGQDQELAGDDASILQYVTAQYVLAPRVLDIGGERPVVLREDPRGVRVTAGGPR